MVVLEVNHRDLELFIERHHETKLSLFIWGTTGIGKSETTAKKGMELAEKHGREFVKWNEANEEKKKEIGLNPSKFFVFWDIRLSQMDPSDVKGIPFPNREEEVTTWFVPKWLRVASLPGIMGFLFFDEINLAPPSIQASAYQLILDRALGVVTISDGVSVLAAGNRIEDKANVYDLPKPLQNRFDHVTLRIPNTEDWSNWAMDHGVDTRIISFIMARPSLLMPKITSKTNDMAFPTPRSWSKNCSQLIHGQENLKTVDMLASSCVGRGAAMEFVSFLKFQKNIDLPAILKNPKKAREIEDMDMKYSLLALIADWYDKHYKPGELEKVLQIADNIQAEFAILMLRFAKMKHEASFRKQAPKLKTWKRIWEKYGKFFQI